MSAVTRERPFSWAEVEPFVERVGWSAQELGRRAAAPGDAVSRSACLRRVAQWKVAGLTVWEADRVATALGLYPSDVWGSAWSSLPPVDLEALFRALRSRERRVRERRLAARRTRARLVAGYRAVERARERGPHRCAPEGCCGSRNAARNVEMAA